MELFGRVLLSQSGRPVTIALFFNMAVSACAFLSVAYTLVSELEVQSPASSWPKAFWGNPAIAFVWFPGTFLTFLHLLNDVFIWKKFHAKMWWKSMLLCDMWADVSVVVTVATITTLIPGSVLAFPAMARCSWSDVTGLFSYFALGLISRVISLHYLTQFSSKVHQILVYELRRRGQRFPSP